MCILKPLDVIDCRLPSFTFNLLESLVISTFISKGHVCTMWLQFFNTFDSIFWELRNKYSAAYINISTQKSLSETFFMLILMYTAEDWLLSSQKMESNVLKNYNHIVKTWPLLIKAYMTRISNRLHKKEGNLQSITLRCFRMHRFCQFL